MTKFIAILFLCVAVSAQNPSLVLPDSPSVTQPPKPAVKQGFWCCWDTLWDGRPARTNREVFHEPYYMTSTLVFAASAIFDTEMTHAGIAHHRCVEGNPYFNTHYPSRGHLYKHDAEEFAVVGGLGFLMTKARIYRWIPVSLAAYGSQMHFRAGASWLQNCW